MANQTEAPETPAVEAEILESSETPATEMTEEPSAKGEPEVETDQIVAE